MLHIACGPTYPPPPKQAIQTNELTVTNTKNCISPVLLRDEAWRVVLQVLHLPDQLLHQLDVATRVHLQRQSHDSHTRNTHTQHTHTH